MLVTRPFNLNFSLVILCCLLFSACSNGQNGISSKKPEVDKKNDVQTSAENINSLLNKQILLTNNAQFTKNRNLEGASGFLIKHNGANFAVTAKHLLGDAGGVEPEVNLNELDKS